MPVTCNGKKKELLFVNTKERLISRCIMEGWNKALLNMMNKEVYSWNLLSSMMAVSNDAFRLGFRSLDFLCQQL